jgi:hypothetical protein
MWLSRNLIPNSSLYAHFLQRRIELYRDRVVIKSICSNELFSRVFASSDRAKYHM